MTLTQLLIFGIYCLLVGWLLPQRWKAAALLAGSLVAVYWLQPSTPIRNLDFWLPTASIGLAALTWAVTRPEKEAAPDPQGRRQDLTAVWVVLAVVLAIGLTRYIEPLCCLTPSRPPALLRVGLALGLAGAAAAIPLQLARSRRGLASLLALLLVGLFIVLKYEPVSRLASAGLRTLSGQPADLAGPLDLRWLGFSYLAFRLIHALRDYQAGKLQPASLGEFLTYALFFPTLTAGPIDRSQHLVGELRRAAAEARPPAETSVRRLASGGERILLGVFKKFVLADSLALVALNSQNAAQVHSAGWAWVLLYAYTLRIYFDFAGYTDVALGLAKLVGVALPENFDRPYLKTNLADFWNSWHITLAQWFRAYFFNPVTRALRTNRWKLPAWGVLLVVQVSTMVLIGLWHGITWNFVAWGAWHGLGLFIHNRWSGWLRGREGNAGLGGPSGLGGHAGTSLRNSAVKVAGWFVTFHYVALGWVWFALPSPDLALAVFRRLLGG